MAFPDITITSLETITAFDIATGNFKFMLDELQSASIAQSEEKVDITGKQGRKLNSLKRNKAVTISGTNGLVSGGMLAVQVGSESDEGFEHKAATPVKWMDDLFVTSNAATTNYIAVGDEGNEIARVYIKNSNGTLGAVLTQSVSADSTHFTYNPETKQLGFSGLDDDTEIAVFYTRTIEADVLENDSGKYAGKVDLYIDAFGEDKCANIYRVQFHIPKADFSGNFTFDMGDNQSVHSFEAEALSGACGTSGLYWTCTVFGEDEGDNSEISALTSIAITNAPTKTAYTAGQSFDPAGMVVKAYHGAEDVTGTVVSNYTYSPAGALTAGNTSIYVMYTENGVTQVAEQAITVS